jgi:hypothetical protein
VKTPSLKGYSNEDIEDIADLFSDAAAGIEMKDVKPEGMHSLKAKQFAYKFLYALAIEIQGKTKE